MSAPRAPLPAKLVMGFLFRESPILRQTLEILRPRFGPMDFVSEPRPFTYTAYYDREMGRGILRQTVSFLDLVPPETLPQIKLFTNAIESEFSREGKRRINIDPGLLSEERFILATGKNYTHRIYLSHGIYADLTLIYQKGAFRTLPWTYPDHRDPACIHSLTALRQKLLYQRTGRLPRRAWRQGGSS